MEEHSQMPRDEALKDDEVAARKKATAATSWRSIGIAIAGLTLLIIVLFLAFGTADEEISEGTGASETVESQAEQGGVDSASGD